MEKRHLCSAMADTIMDAHGEHKPLVLVVIMVDENPDQEGRLEVDAAIRSGNAYTELGASNAEDFAKRVFPAITKIASEVQNGRATIVERPDVELGKPFGKA